MANFYPNDFPREPNPNDPEYVVFQLLRNLPDSYSIFFSKKFKGGNRSKEEAEVDFLIYDGSETVICMEVKGGILEFDGSQNQWLQNNKPMKKAPDWQASAANAAVIEFLQPEGKNLNFGWCLCFPNCSMSSQNQVVSGVPKSLILDEEALLGVEGAIERVRQYYIGKFKRSGVEKFNSVNIVKKLTRNLQFISKVGVRVARDASQIATVTEEQFQLLENLSLNPRLLVQGCAGSGKTMMAQEFAKRLAAEDKEVLLLFYNKAISRKVSRGFDRELPINCNTFHSFARREVEKQFPGWWNTQEKNNDFWDVTLPLKLLDLDFGLVKKFDAIIVDEGQDFKPDWFSVLENFLNDPDESNFSIFYDQMQDIFDRWADLPWPRAQVFQWRLSKNCRNTRSIVSFINDECETNLEVFERSPSGLEVKKSVVEDKVEELSVFKADLKNVLSNGVPSSDIVILLNSSLAESCLAGIKKIGHYQLTSLMSRDRSNTPKVFYSTIDSFKGLEADVVFILDLDNEAKGRDAKRNYTQFSRAKTLLFAYYLK